MAGVAQVEQALRAYAQRGVFRGLDVQQSRGVTDFSLHWLVDAPIQMRCEPRRRELTLRHLLPGLTSRSAMYANVKAFVAQRLSGELPPHRSVDPEALGVKWSLQRGRASLVFKVKNGNYAYAAGRAVNLTHELFVHLNDTWAEYMWQHFGVSSE